MNKWNEAIKIAEIHVARIKLATSKLLDLFPVNEGKVLQFSEEELMLLELLISRFSKLQDYMGRILINCVLQHVGDYEDSMTMIDKLNKLERLEIIDSTAMWEEMLEARNHIAHEYPDKPALTARYLNQIFHLTPHLLKMLDNMKAVLNNHEK